MDYQIREIRESDYPILADFLYKAIFIPKGMKKMPVDQALNAGAGDIGILLYGS